MKPSELTIEIVAEKMQFMDTNELQQFSCNMSRHFKPTRKRMVKGKVREIDALYSSPKRRLKKLHRFLQKTFPPHPSVHGGAPLHSCFTSAQKHLNKKFVITRDIQACYPSISPSNLKDYLRKVGFTEPVSHALSLLMTVHGRVAQGSPISGDALNLLLCDADQHIASVAIKAGLRYTRTYDDMVISGNDFTKKRFAERLLEEQISAHGLQISATKAKRNGFQPHTKEQLVHSLVVNNGLGVKLNAKYQEKARVLAEKYVRAARCVDQDSILGVALSRRIVVGHLQHTRQAEFGPAKHIKRCIKIGDRFVERKLVSVGLGAHRLRWWLISSKKNTPARLSMLWGRRTTAAPSIGVTFNLESRGERTCSTN